MRPLDLVGISAVQMLRLCNCVIANILAFAHYFITSKQHK